MASHSSNLLEPTLGSFSFVVPMLSYECMITKLTKSIPIPIKFLKRWQGVKVFIGGGEDVLIVKKIQQTDSDVLKRLKIVGRSIKKSDLTKAMVSARK